MRMIALIAMREYAENVKTRGFWIGILMFPVILIGFFLFQTRLIESTPERHYILIDQSGQYAEAVQTAIQREHQRRILQDFAAYVVEHRRDADFEQTPANADAEIDQLLDDVDADEVSALETWLNEGGLDVALTMAEPALKEDAPPFVAPGPQFIAADLPPEVDPEASPEIIVEQLRPYLTGQRQVSADGSEGTLFAAIVIPAQVQEAIMRPGALPTGTGPGASPPGIQYWASNLTDNRLPNAVSSSINREIRNNEFAARGVDVQVIREVQRTRMPFNRLDPSKDVSEAAVSMADTFRQWAPVGFVYLMFVSLMTSVQYLLSNTVEEKSNRIIEVLLASVTPGELMMGKLVGIGLSGLTTIAAWLGSAVLFITVYQSAATNNMSQILEVLLTSDLIPLFVFYYLAGYALYAGIFLAIGSLCNTLKEAQSLMAPMMMVLIVPLITMTFIAQDPNGTVARVMSWIPLFTPFTMMNRAAADPPLIDMIGTTLLLALSVVLILWLSGKIFRAGVLRSGQPPKLMELVKMLRGKRRPAITDVS